MRVITLAIIFLAGCSDIPVESTSSSKLTPEVAIAKGDTFSEDVGVPYFFQYANLLHPGSSCQNTSVAMVLAYIGWDGIPDDITSSWGKDYAQSPHNLSDMFNTIASSRKIQKRC